MQTAILNVKLDPETKRQLQEFAAELGIPVSSLINAQIKQMLRERRVTLTPELEPTPYLEKIMEEFEEDLKTEKNIRYFSDEAELASYLDSL